VSNQALGSNQTTMEWVPVSFPREWKRPGRESDHSSPFIAEVRNAWSYTSAPPYVYMAWCLIRQSMSVWRSTSLSTKGNFFVLQHEIQLFGVKLLWRFSQFHDLQNRRFLHVLLCGWIEGKLCNTEPAMLKGNVFRYLFNYKFREGSVKRVV